MFGGCLLGLAMSDIQRCMILVQRFDFLKQRGTRIISEVNKKFICNRLTCAAAERSAAILCTKVYSVYAA